VTEVGAQFARSLARPLPCPHDVPRVTTLPASPAVLPMSLLPSSSVHRMYLCAHVRVFMVHRCLVAHKARDAATCLEVAVSAAMSASLQFHSWWSEQRATLPAAGARDVNISDWVSKLEEAKARVAAAVISDASQTLTARLAGAADLGSLQRGIAGVVAAVNAAAETALGDAVLQLEMYAAIHAVHRCGIRWCRVPGRCWHPPSPPLHLCYRIP
jgi:hypothetical protein